MKTLEKLRTRWLRWLGQKTRCDKPYWTTLLESNWTGWCSKVFEKHGFEIDPLYYYSSRDEVKFFYKMAILTSDIQDLLDLDNVYATELVEKQR